MSLSVIDEALRNLVAVGGDITRAALLDNFCFSSPEREEVLGDIVLSTRGCYDAARAFGVPFISGKDSLYNEWSDAAGTIHTIPPTLLISALGIIDDVAGCVTIDLKSSGNRVYMIGETHEELGGSEYFNLLGIQGGSVPGVNLEQAPGILRCLHRAIEAGCVISCHDCSEGGLALALAETAMSGDVGVSIDLDRVVYSSTPRRFDFMLFSESNTRFLVEVLLEREKEFERIFESLPCVMIGSTTNDGKVTIKAGARQLVSLSLDVIRARWKRKIV
jgi:phosphoribosylformylglycinamidine synthase